MQESIVAALAGNPILTLFVVIGLGYLVGEVGLFGLKFGVAGVLFVGLAVGALSPAIALPELVAALGQVFFVYAIGIQSGPAFFAAFRRQGYRDSLLALGVIAFGAVLTVGFAWLLAIPAPRAAGLFCGALTNTPALAAARDRAQSDEPVVAYSIAYPIGVIGVLICFQVFRRIWRTDERAGEETAPEILVRDFRVTNPGVIGRSVGDVLRLHKDLGFVIGRIRHAGEIDLAKSGTTLAAGDVVAVVGEELALERAQQIFGELSPTRIVEDRSKLDYRRVFVSSKEVVGRRLCDLDLQNTLGATVTRLRRGDEDMVPAPETRLESGDRVRVLTRRENFSNVARFFGDSIRGTAEADFGSVGIGMVLGALVGMFPIPLPDGSVMRLGLAGGPLVVALILGKLEHSGRVTWAIPVSANLTLRQVGLLLFLAGVGTKAGYSFAATLRTSGIQMLAAGAVITFAVTLATLIVGYRVLRIPYDSLMGLMSGVQTQTACLAHASNLSKTEAPNVAYAGVYPVAMIAKILLAQLLIR
ncbi:MAG: transporter [Acidobacteria bacterium]|nr:transporter [Acidobacteriota bacterium]